MESTSGTADLGALRGATGDAAPSAMVVGLREQANHRTVPDVVGVARASECAPKSSGLPAPPVNNGQGAAGGQRELVVRGLADPRLVGRLRFAGLGFARWDRLVAIQLRLDLRSAVSGSPADIAAVSRHEVHGWIEPGKCSFERAYASGAHATPSGVIEGETLRRLAGRPLVRESSAGVRWTSSFGP